MRKCGHLPPSPHIYPWWRLPPTLALWISTGDVPWILTHREGWTCPIRRLWETMLQRSSETLRMATMFRSMTSDKPQMMRVSDPYIRYTCHVNPSSPSMVFIWRKASSAKKRGDGFLVLNRISTPDPANSPIVVSGPYLPSLLGLTTKWEFWVLLYGTALKTP